MTTVAELPAGFADKVLSAQSTFRSVMDAMARPGSVQRIAPRPARRPPMMRGTAAIALTLFDHDTPIWLDAPMSATPDVAQMAQVPHQRAGDRGFRRSASFALVGDPRDAAGARSLRVRQQRISGSFDDADPAGRKPDATGPPSSCAAPASTARRCCGPSIQPQDLFERLAVNAALFPRGIDVVLVHDDAIVAIPRTTRLVAREADHVCCRQGRRTRHRERPSPAGA